MKSLLILGGWLAPLLCLAQSPAAEPALTLDPLVVTATREGRDPALLAPGVTVLDREAIERAQANDLAELLRGLAGVDVARSGGPGAPVSVFLRGAESNHTLFLVDGVRYTSETFLNAQIQNLLPESIERIEILRGPRASQWGSDAIGGVVQIITRRARGPVFQFSGRAGSYGTRDLALRAGTRSAEGGLSAGLQRQTVEGFAPFLADDRERGNRNTSVDLNADRQLGALRLSGRLQQAEGRNQYADRFNGFAPREQDFRNRIGALELEAPLLGRLQTRLRLTLAQDQLTQLDPDDPARPQALSETAVRREGAEWDQQFPLAGGEALLGLSTSRSEIDSRFFSAFGDSQVRDRSERHALFGQYERSLGSLRLLGALRATEHDQFGRHTTGNAEASLPGWGGGRLGLVYGRGFKEPELTDLFGAFGNPALQPETSQSLELNWRQPLGQGQRLSLALFENRVEDLIGFDASFALVNIDRTRTRGLEAVWSLREGPWQASLQGHLQDPENRADGRQLARRSKLGGSARVARRWGGLDLGLDWRGQGERIDSNGARLGGYGLLGADLALPLDAHWRLALRGENLLDRDYLEVDGYRTPGASAYLTLRYEAGSR